MQRVTILTVVIDLSMKADNELEAQSHGWATQMLPLVPTCLTNMHYVMT